MLKGTINRILNKAAFILPGGMSVRPWLHRLRGVKIGKGVWISQFVYMDELHPEALTIGDNCTIGLRPSIFTHFYWGPRGSSTSSRVVIEDDVFIGPHCVILPNVRIGRGAVIKAGSVVSKSVPEYTFFGPPAAEVLGKVTVPLTPEHSYEQFITGLRLIKR